RVIVELFRKRRLSAEEMPAVLVRQHGPFAWGRDAAAAVENARALEVVAKMEILVRATGARVTPPARFLVDKHFLRKHGGRAYYGQGRRS
ncbi:MAG: class II aldolase/adducin family protein, partial [Burkholderiales bacterium]